SLFGDTVLAGLANNSYLELKETLIPLDITGSLNSPIILNSLTFSEGSTNMLNHVFELLTPQQMRSFYRERTDISQEHVLSFTSESNVNSGKRKLIPILDLHALAIIEAENTSTSDILESSPEVYGVIIVFDGPITDIESISFEKYAVQNPDSPNLTAELINTYRFSDQDGAGRSGKFEEILDTLNLKKGGIAGIGEQQINLLVRKQVRPVEKQVAKGLGLYDVRIDYNVGGAILGSLDGEDNASSDKLGVNLISNLYNDQVFLRVKTDLELGAESRETNRNLHISELELTYYLRRNLSLNFTNIRDKSTEGFKPRYSLKYSYEF
ncbi:MAG: hypothetical protein HRT90_12145, partial [Candidatus Margulisbacteria bacterium]|nr:hypothetical protein [Candidatus Margulisiibacteriota bacterium]